MSAFTAAIKELCDTFTSMKNQMSGFTNSVNNFSADVANFREELSSLKKQQKETENIRTEVVSLRAEVAELRDIIAAKEQRQLLKDIEISGRPESKSENLRQIVHVISNKLGIQLDPLEVDDVKRVGARREGEQQRPRPVILTFIRRAPRDQLLKAARVRRGLTSDTLEIPGPATRVYLNEHLSKPNRILFSKARKLGAELRFKYTWTSNGNIFMRRTDTSCDTRDIRSVTGKTEPTAPPRGGSTRCYKPTRRTNLLLTLRS
ncbi:uncharacterized protein LOC134801735 [Cydia splendana]|uniref:uncharacterized protein LOC134801735 n=1 Tax=Cydia splendana TaxID=1100963 RepID=UPI00300D8EDA